MRRDRGVVKAASFHSRYRHGSFCRRPRGEPSKPRARDFGASPLRLRKRAKRTSAGGAHGRSGPPSRGGDRHARQLGFRAVTTRRSIHPDTPLETRAVMRDNEFIVA